MSEEEVKPEEGGTLMDRFFNAFFFRRYLVIAYNCNFNCGRV